MFERVWYTPEQMASFLKIPEKWIGYLIESGRGPTAYKFGNHIRVKKEDFDAWGMTPTRMKQITKSVLKKDIALRKCKKAHPSHPSV